jgi:hypothetical protein
VVLIHQVLVQAVVAVAQTAGQMVAMVLLTVAGQVDCTVAVVDLLQVTHHLQGLAEEAQ